MAIKDNFGNPQGFIGILMLSGMNIGHSPMAKWARAEFTDKNGVHVIADFGGFDRLEVYRKKNGKPIAM